MGLWVLSICSFLSGWTHEAHESAALVTDERMETSSAERLISHLQRSQHKVHNTHIKNYFEATFHHFFSSSLEESESSCFMVQTFFRLHCWFKPVFWSVNQANNIPDHKSTTHTCVCRWHTHTTQLGCWAWKWLHQLEQRFAPNMGSKPVY